MSNQDGNCREWREMIILPGSLILPGSSSLILPGSLFQVLELTGYKLTSGADFKMFSVLAALSQRIVKLE